MAFVLDCSVTMSWMFHDEAEVVGLDTTSARKARCQTGPVRKPDPKRARESGFAAVNSCSAGSKFSHSGPTRNIHDTHPDRSRMIFMKPALQEFLQFLRSLWRRPG